MSYKRADQIIVGDVIDTGQPITQRWRKVTKTTIHDTNPSCVDVELESIAPGGFRQLYGVSEMIEVRA